MYQVSVTYIYDVCHLCAAQPFAESLWNVTTPYVVVGTAYPVALLFLDTKTRVELYRYHRHFEQHSVVQLRFGACYLRCFCAVA